MRKTKIVCTLGPATDDEKVLRSLIENGLDVARINFSHGEYKEHLRKIAMVKKLRQELKKPIALLLDTKGPEIRIKTFEKGSALLENGKKFSLCTQDVAGDSKRVSITYKNLPKEIYRDSMILLDDGLIELKVTDIKEDEVICKVIEGGILQNNKSINLPDINIAMPYLSEKDKEDVLFGIENDFDYVAASFVRNAEDVLILREFMNKNGGEKIHIIAKIENREGVDNIDRILSVSDGIMVARGDMGVEIPYAELPHIQKELIKKGYTAGKKVITATQMLESMINNPRPTRAEITDVANAIYDGTSAIMLSGETAVGKFAVEAVKTMSTIAMKTESDINYKKRFSITSMQTSVPNVTDAISHATCMTAHDLGARAVITVTKGGETARMVSKYRPACPIIACTPDEKVYRQLNLSWGVTPLITNMMSNTDDLISHSIERAVEADFLKSGDLAVITAGVPLGISGTTNLLKVHLVGNILVSGTGIYSNESTACSNLCVCSDEKEAIDKFEDGDILVIPETSNNIMSILKKCSGIICENGSETAHCAIVGLSLDVPVIYNAKHATSILKSGTTVSMDAEKGLVYWGEKLNK